MESPDFPLPKKSNLSHNAITTVIGEDELDRAGKRNIPLRKWLKKWKRTIENLEIRNLDDVRKIYRSADGVVLRSKSVITVFNVKGNEYRLLTAIDYDAGVIEVLDVLTHAEYDKELWKDKY